MQFIEQTNVPDRFMFEERRFDPGFIDKATRRFAKVIETALKELAEAKRYRGKYPINTLYTNRFYSGGVYHTGIPALAELIKHRLVSYGFEGQPEWDGFPKTYERFAEYEIFFNRVSHGELGKVIIFEPKVYRRRIIGIGDFAIYGMFLHPIVVYRSPMLPDEVLEHFLKCYVDDYVEICNDEVSEFSG